MTVTEGEQRGTTTATFTVSLNAPSGTAVTVDVATANGTAIAPGRLHGAAATTLDFAAGETTKTVTVDVQGDVLDEVDETYYAQPDERDERHDRRQPRPRHDHRRRCAADALDQRRDGHRGQCGHGRGDLHGQPERASGQPVSADFATANGTATAPGDYTAAAAHSPSPPARRPRRSRCS